jgi:hypothetical protein
VIDIDVFYNRVVVELIEIALSCNIQPRRGCEKSTAYLHRVITRRYLNLSTPCFLKSLKLTMVNKTMLSEEVANPFILMNSIFMAFIIKKTDN